RNKYSQQPAIRSRVGGGARSDEHAGLRPPLKLHVQFSRMQLSRRVPAGWARAKVKCEQTDKPHLAMPIVPHETVTGVDCYGCISAVVEGSNGELRSNECGTVVGVVQIDILRGVACAGRSEGEVCTLRARECIPWFQHDERVRLPRMWAIR